MKNWRWLRGMSYRSMGVVSVVRSHAEAADMNRARVEAEPVLEDPCTLGGAISVLQDLYKTQDYPTRAEDTWYVFGYKAPSLVEAVTLAFEGYD
jgi:hypothetical protein